MSSIIAKTLSLKYPPLALFYAQKKPLNAKSFKDKKTSKGGWGCIMFLIAQALRGKTVSFSRETSLCSGSIVGMGLGMPDKDNFPGGPEAFLRFLSNGNEGCEEGQKIAKEMLENGANQEKVNEFLKGEGYKKTPQLALNYLENNPKIEPKGPFIIVEPLKNKPDNQPEVVIFMADVEQLSALVVLANYARSGVDNVRIPFGSGCSSIALLPLYENTQKEPKAVVGLTDLSARLYLRKLMDRDLLSFAIPWKLYLEMEDNVQESFLSRPAWKKLRGEEIE